MAYSAAAEPAEACPSCGHDRYRAFDGRFGDARASTRDLSHGDHATLIYDDPELLAPFCARYLTEGLDRGERAVAVAPADLRAGVERLLAAGVGPLIDWIDPATIYGDFDADRVAAVYEELFGNEPRFVRILAVFDSSCAVGTEAAEMDRYERMAHAIIARHGATALCLYDTRGLDPSFVETAVRRHGLAVHDGAVLRNELFEFEPA